MRIKTKSGKSKVVYPALEIDRDYSKIYRKKVYCYKIYEIGDKFP